MCCLEHSVAFWEFLCLHVRVRYCSLLPHGMLHGPVCICVNVGSDGLGLWHRINRKGSTAISGYNVKRWCITPLRVAATFNTRATKNGMCPQAQFLFFFFVTFLTNFSSKETVRSHGQPLSDISGAAGVFFLRGPIGCQMQELNSLPSCRYYTLRGHIKSSY